MTLPTLFVPHGAPTFALRPGAAGAALVDLAQTLERPKAIIVVSPHWETREPTVGSAIDLETIYTSPVFRASYTHSPTRPTATPNWHSRSPPVYRMLAIRHEWIRIVAWIMVPGCHYA